MWDRRTLLALADGWLGLVWASLLGEFVATTYFDSLRSLGPRPSLGLLTLLLAPAFLAIPGVRAVAHRLPILAAVAMGAAPWIEPVVPRAAVLGVGFVGVSLALLDAALARPRAAGDAWLAGICGLFVVRWWLGSVDPLATDARLAVGAAVLTLIVALARPVESAGAPGSGRVLGGVAFGAAIWLVHSWFVGPTAVVRWAGFGPDVSAAVVVALGLGFAVNAVTRAEAAWLAVVGAGLLAVAHGPMALVGGWVLAFALPSIWSDALLVLARAGPRAIVSAGATYLGLLGLEAAAFARDYGFDGAVFRIMVSALVVATATLAAMPGLGRTPGRERGTLVPARFAAVGIAVAAAVIGVCPRPAPDLPPVDVAMTWNLQQGFATDGRGNLAAVAEVVRREGVTVLGLQECGPRSVSGGLDPVAHLAEVLGMYAAIAPGPREASFGVALLSSHPVLAVEAVVVPSDGDHAVVLLATIDVRGRPLAVAVTHLGGPSGYREGQARAVAAALAAVEGRLLVLGDFDLEPDAETLTTLLTEGRVRNAAVDRLATKRDDRTVDHVLDRNLAVDRARAPDTGGISDHRPVLADFTLP